MNATRVLHAIVAFSTGASLVFAISDGEWGKASWIAIALTWFLAYIAEKRRADDNARLLNGLAQKVRTYLGVTS